MYLVSPDYLNRNERSATLKQESPPFQNAAKSTNPKKKKTRARVNRKKKEPQHPYDKWVAMRGKIAEAAVGRKELIKAIANFIKVVLPDTTLTQKLTTPRNESGTQTDMNLATPPPPRSAPLPSTSSAGDVVYETETSPFSAGFTLHTVLLHLAMMMMMMMGIQVLLAKMWIQVLLAKARHVNMLESLSGRLLVHT